MEQPQGAGRDQAMGEALRGAGGPDNTEQVHGRMARELPPSLGLPEHVLTGAILARLDTPLDVVRARLVCRLWAQLVPASVRVLRLSEGGIRSPSALAWALQGLPALEELELSSVGWTRVRGDDSNMLLVALGLACPGLRRVVVRVGGLHAPWATSLLQLLRCCRRLDTLCVADPNCCGGCPAGPAALRRLGATREGSSSLGVGAGPSGRARGSEWAGDRAGEELRQGPAGHSAPGPWAPGSQLSLSQLSLPQCLVMTVADAEAAKVLAGAAKQRVRQLCLRALSPRSGWAEGWEREDVTRSVLDSALQCSGLTHLCLHHMFFSSRAQAAGAGAPPASSTGRGGWEPDVLFQKLALIGRLQHLQTLELDGTDNSYRERELRPLPDTWCALKGLRVLALKFIPGLGAVDAVCHMPALRELTLAHCGTQSLPDTICWLSHLETLRIRSCGNGGFILPDTLGGLSSLKQLQLQDSPMTFLPDSVCQMLSLRSLGLSGCHSLRALPESLTLLTSLKDLDIRGCFHLAGENPVLQKLTNVAVERDSEENDDDDEYGDDFDYDEDDVFDEYDEIDGDPFYDI